MNVLDFRVKLIQQYYNCGVAEACCKIVEHEENTAFIALIDDVFGE